jgi:NAD(P)-dependent dehydrogenase (short-subunit alcohol dehydrogenase family)
MPIERSTEMTDLDTFPQGFQAIVIGATGGIGGAFVEALVSHPRCGRVVALSRASTPRVDLLDEQTLAAASAALSASGPFHMIITAVGILQNNELQPEKSLRALTPDQMARSFAINAIGPALVIKHFSPLLPKTGRSV